MKSLSWRMICAVVVCGVEWWGGREAAAQSSGGAVPSLAPSPAVQVMQSSYPLFAPTVPNTMGDPTATAGAAAAGGIFNSPMAAPMLYSSMLGASLYPNPSQNQSGTSTNPGAPNPNLAATQLGMMMLLANQQNGGIGSGRLSGTRGDPRQQGSSDIAKSTSKSRVLTRPGGVASKYFNRTNVRRSNPRSYFDRRPSNFP